MEGIPADVTVNRIEINSEQVTQRSGRYYVPGHGYFAFNATYASGQPYVVQAVGFYSNVPRHLYPTRVADGSFDYLLSPVTEPWTITFITTEFESLITGTETVAGTSVHTYKNILTVSSDKTATADVYTMTGILYKRLTVTPGITKEILPGGVYIVILDGRRFKVISQ
jgi:hypothetical protein